MSISTIGFEFLIIAIILVLILVFIFITGKYEKTEVIKTSYALGTLINLRAYGNRV